MTLLDVPMLRLIPELHSGHHLATLVKMWGLFSLAATINFALKAYAGDHRFSLAALRDAHFPLEPWRGRSAKFDLAIFIITNAIYRIPFRIAAPVITAGLLTAALTQLMPHHQVYRASFAISVGGSFLLFLVGDFALYCSHSIQHSVPVLWEFHKVHHSATFLSPLTGDRRHPFCIYFDAVFAAIVIGAAAGVLKFMFDFNLVEMFLMMVGFRKFGRLAALDSLKHSHFPISLGKFESFISSPRMHQIHHSCKPEHLGKNRGDVFCIWDRLFGTCYVPVAKESKVLGLSPAAQLEYGTMRDIYIGPFLRAGRLIKHRLRSVGEGSLRPENGDHQPRMPAVLNQAEEDMSAG